VGIPHKAWNHEPEWEANQRTIKKYFPCLVEKCVNKNKPIFESCSLMPDLGNSWIRLEKGVRRLQPCELAKAKSVPNTWTTKDLRWESSRIQHSTCLHTWIAAMH
jgi:hypothetical protein